MCSIRYNMTIISYSDSFSILVSRSGQKLLFWDCWAFFIHVHHNFSHGQVLCPLMTKWQKGTRGLNVFKLCNVFVQTGEKSRDDALEAIKGNLDGFSRDAKMHPTPSSQSKKPGTFSDTSQLPVCLPALCLTRPCSWHQGSHQWSRQVWQGQSEWKSFSPISHKEALQMFL